MTPSIRQRLQKLGVDPAEVEESHSRSSGPGGQHVNKTSTAMTLRCESRDLSVSVQDTRSQARNRELAWQRLADALERRQEEQIQRRVAAREKERRRNRQRPRALKRRILEAKRHRGERKRLRGKVEKD